MVLPVNDGANLLFMSIRSVSKAYGIPERYLRSLDHQGRLPCIKSGNRASVNVPMLLALIENECQRGGQGIK